MWNQLLELVAKDLQRHQPEDIRCNIEQVNILVCINRMVTTGFISSVPDQLKDIYQRVMLRDIQEIIPSGTES